jgi:hypothetical protein
MQVVRQHHNGVDDERVPPSRVAGRSNSMLSVSSRNRRSAGFTVKK